MTRISVVPNVGERFPTQPRVNVSQSATPRLVKGTLRPREIVTPRLEEVARTPRFSDSAMAGGEAATPRPGAEPYKTKTYRTQQATENSIKPVLDKNECNFNYSIIFAALQATRELGAVQNVGGLFVDSVSTREEAGGENTAHDLQQRRGKSGGGAERSTMVGQRHGCGLDDQQIFSKKLIINTRTLWF